jgi:hypothetical protein
MMYENETTFEYIRRLEKAVEALREALLKGVHRQGFTNDELIAARKLLKETKGWV